MVKMNAATLKSLERVLTEGEYVVRYERGNFQSGYCLLEQKKVVVLNKFLDTEGRINTLLDLIPIISLQVDLLTHDSQKLYQQVCAQKLNLPPA